MDTGAVRMDDVEVRVGGATIVGPLTLRVGRGEHWAILGPNGSGKTTLLSVAGAWRHPSAGRAWVLGERLGRTDVRRLRAGIGHVGHHVDDAFRPRMGVLDVVLTGRASTLDTWFEIFGPDDVAEAESRLAQVGCAALRDRQLVTLSQGERQRVRLARALFGRPRLLLFDEPAAGLDLPGRETLLESMTRVAGTADAPTTLIATHHLEELPMATTHAAALRRGGLVGAGPVAEILTGDVLSHTFDMSITVSREAGRWSARARAEG